MKIVNVKKLKKELNKLNDTENFVSISKIIRLVYSATEENTIVTNQVIDDTEYWKSGNKHYKTIDGKTQVISKKDFDEAIKQRSKI